MKKKTLNITISAEGKVTIDVKGAVGGECLKWTAQLEKDLGVTDARHTREMKAEFFETSEVEQTAGAWGDSGA
jgi:hypothetical protein